MFTEQYILYVIACTIEYHKTVPKVNSALHFLLMYIAAVSTGPERSLNSKSVYMT